MRSQALGKSTSEVEVLNVSPHGIWIFVKGKEHFLNYEDCPWFQDAKVSSIYNVDLASPNHLHWPELDVDLEIESLERPQDFPLVYS